jgi:MoxR-like ATPase
MEKKIADIDTSWYIFHGDGREPHNEIKELNKKAPPPLYRRNKANYFTTGEEIATINAAIYLRRPLLLTGRPGTGKSSLAHAVAKELGLELITWAINSKTTLEDGLYHYDAISRLHDAQRGDEKEIQEYVSLGSLGKAFALGSKSVLLIDELDKSDIDLPNDLLHILEENEFEIPVLKRYKQKTEVNLGSKESPIMIKNGKKKIDIKDLPIIIITSNKERDFSQAFMRRCLHHHINFPLHDRLVEIACMHLDEESKTQHTDYKAKIEALVTEFLEKREGREKRELATDQLLNAVYLMFKGKVDVSKSDILQKSVWHSLDS